MLVLPFMIPFLFGFRWLWIESYEDRESIFDLKSFHLVESHLIPPLSYLIASMYLGHIWFHGMNCCAEPGTKRLKAREAGESKRFLGNEFSTNDTADHLGLPPGPERQVVELPCTRRWWPV